MRVLICIATMNGGGAERQVSYLAKGLTDLGHDVHVALLEGGPYLERLAASGAVIHFLDIYPKRMRFVGPVLALFRTLRPDVVYLWQRPFDVIGGIAAAVLRVPCFHAERTDPAKIARGPKKLLRNLVVRLSNGVIANSDAGVAYWTGRLFNHTPIAKVPNIIPTADLTSIVPAVESAGCALLVGRLDENKNVTAVVRAIARLRDEGVALPLLIAGDGPLREELSSYISTHGLTGQVTLCGFRNDVWALMKGCHVFVSLSRSEGEPNTVLEAAALGCSLILSDIPAHRSIASFDRALFVSADDEEDIARALRTALQPPTRSDARCNETALLLQTRRPVSVSQMHIELFTQALGTTAVRANG